MENKDIIIKLCMERQEMISKLLHYDLKQNELFCFVRDAKEICAILDEEADIRKQWINKKIGEENE